MSSKRKRSSKSSEPGEIVPPKVNKRTKTHTVSASLPTNDKFGVVLATGGGDVGQLGLGNEVLEKLRPALVPLKQKIVDICAGGMHTVCLTDDGKVITFGCNDEGALGRNTSDKEDAEFYPGEVELPSKAIQISAGDSHTAALLDNGKVFAWGTFRDSHGNMGMTVNGNEKLPYEIWPQETAIKISSGADHLVVLTNEGQIYTCGCGEQGQLGRVSERGSNRDARGGVEKLVALLHVNFKLSLKLSFDDIWAGTYATFAKVADKDDIYVFGLNNYHQLGLPETTPHFFPTLSKEFSKHKWSMICSAPHHTIALDERGVCYAIGRKEYGRLGLGEDCNDAETLTEIPVVKDKKVVHIGSGSATSFAVTEKGELYGWGMGTSGQLGTGQEDDCLQPTLIMSKQLETRNVFKVTSGGQHTIILAKEQLKTSNAKNNNHTDST